MPKFPALPVSWGRLERSGLRDFARGLPRNVAEDELAATLRGIDSLSSAPESLRGVLPGQRRKAEELAGALGWRGLKTAAPLALGALALPDEAEAMPRVARMTPLGKLRVVGDGFPAPPALSKAEVLESLRREVEGRRVPRRLPSPKAALPLALGVLAGAGSGETEAAPRLPSWLREVVDTEALGDMVRSLPRKGVAARLPELGGAAAVHPQRGTLIGAHVAADPAMLSQTLRELETGGFSLLNLGSPSSDLGRGLYWSAMPRVWRARDDRAFYAWDTLYGLEPEEWKRFARAVLELRPPEPAASVLRTLARGGGSERVTRLWGASPANLLPPYLSELKERVVGAPFLKKLGIKSSDPVTLPVEARGRYGVVRPEVDPVRIRPKWLREAKEDLALSGFIAPGLPMEKGQDLPSLQQTVTKELPSLLRVGAWKRPAALGALAAGAVPTRAEAATDPRFGTGPLLRETASRALSAVRPAAEAAGETALDVLRFAAPAYAPFMGLSSALGGAFKGEDPLRAGAAGLAQAGLEPFNVLSGEDDTVPGYTYLGRELIPESFRKEHPGPAFLGELLVELGLGAGAAGALRGSAPRALLSREGAVRVPRRSGLSAADETEIMLSDLHRKLLAERAAGEAEAGALAGVPEEAAPVLERMGRDLARSREAVGRAPKRGLASWARNLDDLPPVADDTPEDVRVAILREWLRRGAR